MSKPSNRRRHPAQVARVAATGISTASMFAMMTVLGVGSNPDSETPPVDSANPSIDTVNLTGNSSAATQPSASIAAPEQLAAVETPSPAVASPAPVQLTSNPVVRVVQAPAATAAPTVKTSGS